MRSSAIPVAMMLLLAVLVAGGCAAGPSKTPSPTPSGPLTTAELRYRLIGAFGPLWFCDPDQYPVARTDEAALAVQRFGEVQADTEAFSAILAHLGLTAGADITADQKLAIYRSWKQLNAIHLEPVGTNNRFDYINAPTGGATEGRRTTGTIDDHGSIRVEQQDPSGQPPCPV